ncbi:universal stress protein [Dermatophilaceae bacterium Sec6.4]|nr:universal stress protein [Actinomycetota bacterium]
MTIVIGLAPGTKGHAALQLGAVLARSRAEDLVVATVVKAPWPPDPFQGDREYLAYQEQVAKTAVEQARTYLGAAPLGVEYVVHRARSVSTGLLQIVEGRQVSMVVLGSSSTGVLGQVMLGAVTERLLHSADLPTVIAPRGYRASSSTELTRVSVAFGRADHDSALLTRAARRAHDFGSTLRVVCFAVRPMAGANEAVELDAEQSVVDQWRHRLEADVASTMGAVTDDVSTQVVLGEGATWDAAIQDVEWTHGDLLVVGTSSGPLSRFFLGSHAAKIVRNSPVPVLLLPRS